MKRHKINMHRGEHNKPGKTKEIIVQCILVSSDGLEEPMLRDYLRSKYDIKDQKTIRKHLEELRKAKCIKKYETSGSSNIWKIEKIEHFSEIYDRFPGLRPDLHINKILIDLLIQKHRSMLKEQVLEKYFKSFIEDSPQFLEIFLKRNTEDILKAASHLPEINTNFYNTEIKDNILFKIYHASKIIDILNGY